MKKNEKNSYLRSFFGLVPQSEGELRGQAPYPEVLKSLGYRGARKQPKMTVNCSKKEKMTKCEKNSKLRSFFGLI